MKERINDYIRFWKCRGYRDGIPDEVPARLMQLFKAPSYRAVAIAILKNDVSLKSLGLDPGYSPWYSMLKRVEISQRKKPVVRVGTPLQAASITVGRKLC